jgi:hypothetical protein
MEFPHVRGVFDLAGSGGIIALATPPVLPSNGTNSWAPGLQ